MKNAYSLGEIVKNGLSLVYTKIFYSGARLIRRPIFVRGKKYLQYGAGFTTGYNCRLEMFGDDLGKKLIIGENCKIGDNVHLAACEKIEIGKNCLMASKIFISDNLHGNYSGDDVSSPLLPPDERPLQSKPISIGDNVWIGENVCILAGVKIGNGCIIGANAVVNKDISENCIAAGVPAKAIKKYDFQSKTWMTIDYTISE